MRQLNRRYFFVQFATVGSALVFTGAQPLGSWAQPAAPTVESKSGIVVAVDRNQIFVNSANGALTLRMKSSVRIWKGEDGAPIDAIKPGDDLAMRGSMDSDGTFVPSEIWVNITALDGVIKKLDAPNVEIDVVRNDSIQQTKTVRITGKTLSVKDSPLKREQLQVGRHVRVIGLALEDGTIQASRITVYVGGRPVDSEGSKLVDPLTGRIIERR